MCQTAAPGSYKFVSAPRQRTQKNIRARYDRRQRRREDRLPMRNPARNRRQHVVYSRMQPEDRLTARIPEKWGQLHSREASHERFP